MASRPPRRRLPVVLLALGLLGLGGLPGRLGAEESWLSPLAADHWARPLLDQLVFPPEAPSPARVATRLDAALRLARWMERGQPSPQARPRLLAAELKTELTSLGLSAETIAEALDSREATPVSSDLTDLIPIPTEAESPEQVRIHSLLRKSLAEFDRLEGRILDLRAEDRKSRTRK